MMQSSRYPVTQPKNGGGEHGTCVGVNQQGTEAALGFPLVYTWFTLWLDHSRGTDTRLGEGATGKIRQINGLRTACLMFPSALESGLHTASGWQSPWHFHFTPGNPKTGPVRSVGHVVGASTLPSNVASENRLLHIGLSPRPGSQSKVRVLHVFA